VLAATTFIPSGRSLFIGFDETWLWRNPYGDRYTERFWRAAVRNVAIGKLRSSDKRFDLRTDKERYILGEPIQITARVLDEEFRKSRAEVQLVYLQRNDRPVEEIRAERMNEGHFERTIRADLPGTYRLWLEHASQPDKRLSQRILEVQLPTLESLEPALDQAQLSLLSGQTGGQYFGLDQAEQLLTAIDGDSRRIPDRTETQDLWDRWPVLIGVLLLLTIEWAARKRLNLL
jgi:hypothetical protein